MWHWAERVYPHLPVWLQNSAISLYGAAYRNERLGGRFDCYVEEFEKRERWTAAQMRDYLNEQLSRLLVRSFQQSRYYRDAIASAGLTSADLTRFTAADLPALPITPKQALRRDPWAFVAADRPRRRLHTYFSSGSTGTPITCVYSTEAHRKFYAARETRSFRWAGTSIRHRRSMIGGRLVTRPNAGPPYYRYNYVERQLYFSAFHISPSRISGYVEGFERYRPEVLTGYSHAHYALARMMMAAGVRLSYEPRAAVLGSDKLTSQMKQVIRDCLRVRPYEEYGSVENCFLATECEAGSLHVNPDFGIVEIVDENGLPAQEGKVLCTGLLNDAQFLIRYAIGDVAAWSDRPCPCGRDHLPVLREVIGREEDAVVTPDGRETVRLQGLFIDIPSVVEGQVVQEELDLVRVRVVPAGEFGSAERRVLQNRVLERLPGIRVVVECVPELPKTDRGKVRAVISNINTRGANGAPLRV
ncbi:MAG TPA: hypothetical protein VGF59_30925 [Bryobacteraceae bacterium]